MVRRFGFGKKERLKSRKRIEELFLNGQRFVQPPLRVVYQFSPSAGQEAMQVGVAAAKKNFKKAVDRNLIKRRLRESYRLQKPRLLEAMRQKNLQGEVFFMYNGKTIASFSTIRQAMEKALLKLQNAASQFNENLS